MSRRGTGAHKMSPPAASLEQVTAGSLSLEQEEMEPLSISTSTSSSGSGEPSSSGVSETSKNGLPTNTKFKQWKESAFAAAFTEPNWTAEGAWTWNDGGGRSRRSRRKDGSNRDGRGSGEGYADDYDNIDTTGCLCCSSLFCSLLGAQRIGNMVVLNSSMEWVEEVEEDPETGECKVRRYTRPTLRCVVGPYWPMLLCVTYPLIFIVSGWAYYTALWPGKKPVVVTVVWVLLTGGLIVALALTGCRDPGILYRHDSPPPQFENNWRWSDQAHSYRPRSAYFDSDTGVVVEEFDHTCPWTGTAIGKKNMICFQFFVCLVFVCLVVDIFLITGAF